MKTVTVRKTFLNDGKVVRPGTDDNPTRITITNSRALALAKRGMVGDLEDAVETSEEEKREQFAAALPKARISSDPESATVTIAFPTIEVAQTFREQFALMQRHAGEFVRPSTGAITSESFDLTAGRGEGSDDDDQTQGGEGQEGAGDDAGDDAGGGDETGADDQDAGGSTDDQAGAGDTTDPVRVAGDVVVEKPGDQTEQKPGDEKPADDKPGDEAPAARRPRGQRKPDAG